jgi:uncharacterized protein (DUF2147 family)
VRTTFIVLAGYVLGAGVSVAQANGVLGVWREPTGARIEVHSCGPDVCLKLLKLSDNPPGTLDGHNPDQSLRTRPLLGLEIGTGFHLTDPSHAEGGMIYDPKSGKTYHGTISSEGDALKLRGYVGIKAFGRTETWSRDTSK